MLLSFSQYPEMHPKKRENLLALSHKERADYTVRHAADFEEIWGLLNPDQTRIFYRRPGQSKVLPVWPHKSLAEACCPVEKRKAGALPCRIRLGELLQVLVPQMASRGASFGVFYDKTGAGLTVPAHEFGRDLLEESLTLWE